MKKIILLLILPLIIACGKKDEKTIENVNYKNVKVLDIKETILSKTDQSNGVLEPIKEVSQVTDTGGRIQEVNFKNGDFIKKNQVILKMTDRTTESEFFKTKASYNSSISDYQTKKINFNKYLKLYKEKLVSQDDFLNIKNLYTQATNQMELNKSLFLKAREDYNNLTVKAKISGFLTDMDLKQYQKVDANKTLFTLVDDSTMEVKTSISPNEISSLKLLNNASVTPENSNVKYLGKVSEINPVADPDTKRFKVKVLINNKNHTLKKGIYTKISINTGEKLGYIVPKESIVVKDLYSYIFIVIDDTVKQIRVSRGYASEKFQEILSNKLPKTFKLVTDGQFLLNDRDPVKIIK